MKIVFFSDIHANIPALEAFFEDVETLNPEAIYCLGDLVGYNIWPGTVVDEIQKRRIPTIMGNHEEALLASVADEVPTSNRGLTRSLLSDQQRDYLIHLPRHMSLSFGTEQKPFKLLMVHGSTKAINDYMVVDYPQDEVLGMMRAHQADVLLCGHTHLPFHRVLADGDRYRHVINIGSVGKPKDGDPRGCYAVVEMNSATSASSPELQVTFRRIAYDVERAAQAVEQSGFDDALAQALRIGR
ncbi:metallophosphatase family protein [Reichenbachiella carrageenanivorans]|uniref:Metallophosphatase family protein n=1 Tax=Reichenbachiella carrageenanivorans TaxID=2979869 RepID=A0ABY6CXM8_9BACT|nr:metallophosphoesterase family protein [Reichenbachiella carrageenanivorans]UXX78667.1 metallophosphatase family protein [Reichenbachiella carrageenanivorans]